MAEDRNGNAVYLTEERWRYITDESNHPEVSDYENHLKLTIQQGKRKQEPLNPRKYRYYKNFSDLPDGFNHVVVIALFGVEVDDTGRSRPNNFIATAFFKHIRES